jgi:enoyl-[acyl-carrier protein] reductase I
MAIIDLSNKTALITGVADNIGFGWHIAKALQESGAEIILSSHPRIISILERFLTKEKYRSSRILANGLEFKPKLIIPCDVSIDDWEDLSLEKKTEKGYETSDVSIHGMIKTLQQAQEKIDILIHSVAFSPEIERLHLDVSRQGYLTAMSVSSYSLIALSKALLPFMVSGTSIIALSYLAAERAVPFYGGGMASAKAALECDARMLCWQLGEAGHRVNIISAGPYASRAAKSVGDIAAMIEKTKKKSPLRRAIDAKDVANTALFLASDLSCAITGEIIHVDAGFHAMALV